MLRSRISVFALVCLAAAAGAGPAHAQFDILSGKPLGGAPGGKNDKPVVTAEASFSPPAPGQTAKLSITANIAPGWHIYSITQKPGGPLKTRIVLDPGPDYEVVGNFTPTETPETKTEPLFDNLEVETHESKVTWHAELKLKDGADPTKLQIKGRVISQACNAGSCLPPSPAEFVAGVSESNTAVEPPATSPIPQVDPDVVPASPPRAIEEPNVETALPSGIYRPEGQHITLRGQLRRVVDKNSGQKLAELILRAEPDADWHVYALARRDPAFANPNSEVIGKPTLIVIENNDGLELSEPVPSEKPVPQLHKPGEAVTPPWYTKPIDWTIRIPLTDQRRASDHTITGLIGFQVCHNIVGKCDQPGAARFTVTFPTRGEQSEPIYLTFTKAKAYREVAQFADRLAATEPPIAPSEQRADLAGLPVALALAFLGGLILNLMPCVLPVIGLKILSFVEQAGQKRHQVLMLNLWYTLGILLVFWVLAGLAVTLNLGWGQHFGSTPFNVTLCAIVFVMALSFLGVWEIPIPGFVGGSTASKIAAQEGAFGAISKGAITTILATPCTGPFLTSVFSFMLNKPPAVVFALFTAIGLGMSGPYLLIGAFPSLIRGLPKPGAWMETFKHLMGFVLLGTVVFLFTFMNRDYVVPTFAMLVGLWAACWWIGRIPYYVPRTRKATSWVGASAFALLIGLFAFSYLVPSDKLVNKDEGLPWEPFSRPRLAQLSAEGKTVMIDFTADWCLTCKWNLKQAIDTKNVREVVKSNGIVPLLADWSDGSEEIQEVLAALQRYAIPVLVVYPAGSTKPIILDALLTEQQVIEALKQAGPSMAKSPEKSTTVMIVETDDRS